MSNQLRKRFSGWQITIMVVAACITLIATPVAVRAATGSVVNIADRSNATRLTHVDSSGDLYTTQRASASGKNVDRTLTLSTQNAFAFVFQTSSPTVAVLTDLQLSWDLGGDWAQIDLEAYYRTSGTGTCSQVAGGTTTGYTEVTLRSLRIPAGIDNLQLNWNGPGLTVPVSPSQNGTGQPTCLILHAENSGSSSGTWWFGVTYYTYTP